MDLMEKGALCNDPSEKESKHWILIYFLETQAVPIAKVPSTQLLRTLGRQLKAAGSIWEIAQYADLVGTINPKP